MAINELAMDHMSLRDTAVVLPQELTMKITFGKDMRRMRCAKDTRLTLSELRTTVLSLWPEATTYYDNTLRLVW